MKAKKISKDDDEAFSKMPAGHDRNEGGAVDEEVTQEDGKVQAYSNSLPFLLDVAVALPSVAMVPVYAILLGTKTH